MNTSGTDIIIIVTYFLLLFLSIFWLLVLFSSSGRDSLKEKGRKKKLDHFPFFTTIIPAYNEEHSIVETIQSVVHLDYPKEKMEVIIVNDGSTDRTQEVVEQYIREIHSDVKITLINQENQGKGKAMNRALFQAKGEYFACLDADSSVHANALQEMLPYFADQEVAAVCPLLKVKKPKNLLQKVQWYEYVINMFYKHLNAKIDCVHVTPGPFSIYRTKIIQDLGGYDEHNITEDLEIAIRLQKHQYKIIQTFDAIVETTAPETWKELFNQRIRWYKGSVENSIAYRNLIFNKKYGDFGFIRMPTIIASGIIAVVLLAVLGEQLIMKLLNLFTTLKAINFDVITLLKNYSFHFNLLSMPFFKFAIAVTLVGISFFVMIYSFKIVQEKITNHGKTWLSVITYLSIYSLFISIVWVQIAILFIRKKKNTW